MNAVIYARYSSERQTEASIEGQLKVCYDYAEKQGYTIIGEYIDRALTGRNTDRPQFLKMIKDSSKQEFQIVLVYQLDRFSRNRYDSATYKAKLSASYAPFEIPHSPTFSYPISCNRFAAASSKSIGI